MDIEIWLDCQDVSQDNLPLVDRRFMEWYNDGSEVRHNKVSFNSLTPLDQPYRYLIDLGYADFITSCRNLHARLRRLGVKVFIHFNG